MVTAFNFVILFSLLCSGRAEVNIMPWEEMLRAIKKGNKRIKWEKREPYAYWRGNPYVAADRVDLLKCNFSDKYDWNVRLYTQVIRENYVCFSTLGLRWASIN